jgi:hypothetical protein
MDTWTPKIDAMLLILRENCNYMSKYHNFKYQFYKERLKWFRIPIIVLSAVNAFTAVGLQPYTAQRNISTINSILSLLCGILTSIEMFLNVQKKMENDLMSHKDYYTLSMDIFKMVSLDLSKRNTNGRDFLEEKVGEFKKLIQNSNVIDVDFYIDIYEEDPEESKEDLPMPTLSHIGELFDIENGHNPDKIIHKARESIKTKLRTSTSARFTDKLEKLCTPNNHRINKCRKDMQQNVQKYSKTIRPNLDASETVYTGGIGRTNSMEDMTNTVSNSGKYKVASPGRRYTHGSQNNSYTAGQQAYTTGQQAYTTGAPYTAGQQAYTQGAPGYTAGQQAYTQGAPGYTTGQQAYTAGAPGYTAGQQAYTAGQQAYTAGQQAYTAGAPGYTTGAPPQTAYTIPSPPSMYDSRGPVLTNTTSTVKKPRGTITIIQQGETPPPASTVLPEPLEIDQMMQLIPFETPKDIMANGEHKDAGHEDSSISTTGMGGDSL